MEKTPGHTKLNADANAGSLLLSRRAFLYGTAVAGAATATALAASGCSAIGGGDEEIPSLKVSDSQLVTLNDFQALESIEGKLQLIGQYDLPYGTLVWANDDALAACLLPTETGSPLAQIGLMSLGDGSVNIVRERAVSAVEHYEVYDVRAVSSGLIWTEANVLKGRWRVFTSRVVGGQVEGDVHVVDEGDSTYDTPMLAATADRAFWQVVPKQPNDAGLPSRLMAASYGRDDATCVYENVRRMGTPPYASSDSVTIAPRLDNSTPYYQLTNIKASSGNVNDTLTLPGGMSPLEVGYGDTGFMFSFADIYNYGDGISNLGTYTPMRFPSGGDYSGAKWFGFARTPTAAPSWCNGMLIVKSSYSVCGVDLADNTYCAIDVDDGAEDYGDYLASSGTHGNFVTFTNIDHKPIGKPPIHSCRVKVWTTV